MVVQEAYPARLWGVVLHGARRAGGASVPVDEHDDTLVRRAQEDPAAFEPLYERYVDQIYNYIYYRVANVHDAEDLTARTFYQALTHLRRYSSQGVPFSAWLFRIAHNLVANWYRDRSRRTVLSLDSITDSSDPLHDITDGVESAEEKQALWQAVRRLPPERQQVLVLKYVDNLSMAEIAVIMGRSEGAVKALLHRTLVALRQEINPGSQTRGKSREGKRP
jgi:RNA polymerase sigma-70 factor (ECF subfamily)